MVNGAFLVIPRVNGSSLVTPRLNGSFLTIPKVNGAFLVTARVSRLGCGLSGEPSEAIEFDFRRS